MSELWKEPLKRVEETLKGKIDGVSQRVDRHDSDIDDIRQANREMFGEQREWMQAVSSKLDQRHEDLQAQNITLSSLVDKLSVIEARNSKDIEALTLNVNKVTAAVEAITPVVMDLKSCKDRTESSLDELQAWKDREEGARNATSEIESKMWQKKELWIGVIGGGAVGFVVWIIQFFIGG